MIQTAPRPEPEIRYARILFRGILTYFPPTLGIGLIHKFLVCAISDYNAQRPEEMSFDEGDMIAVTRFSPNECWWTGLLLDDHRQNNCQCFLLVQRTNFIDIYGSGWNKYRSPMCQTCPTMVCLGVI